MFHYTRDIFDFFSDRSILQHFCDEINRSDADVYILMAHKAVQLFQVLLDQEHIEDSKAQKMIISSLALDYDCQYLVNKKIAIIDDIVISGTSIASAVHKLLAVGVSADNIEIITLARDRKYQTMTFDNDMGYNSLHCDTILDDAACIGLSYSISKAFSFYGIPYDIDYPTYSAINLQDNKLQMLFSHFLWRTESTTNSDQQAGGVTPYILFPKQTVLTKLWERIGVDLSNCVHMKIRAYVRRYSSGRLECSIVPMCLFNEIAEADLEKLYDLYAPKPQKICLNRERILVAQMRYLEFYIAHQMYLVFDEITSLGAPHVPTKSLIRILFGYNDGEKISAHLKSELSKSSKVVSISSVDYIDHDMLKEFLDHEIGREMANNLEKAQLLDLEEQNNWINQIILAPFLWWYDTKEIPVRKAVMYPVKHYIRDYENIEGQLNRLRSGFSLRTLQFLLNDDLSNDESRVFISLFLDHAIDRGIIVPTIFHNTSEHYLCRAYRHGEDLPFSLEDECRLVYYLHEISDRIPGISIPPSIEPLDGGLAEIAFEKMIVLFYQMGIRQTGIFNRFLGFNNIRILKPFLSLHGAIQAYIDPQQMQKQGIEKIHFYSEKDPSGNRYITWLTNWVRDNGFAWNPKDRNGNKSSDYFLNQKKMKQYLEKNERSCIDEIIKIRISDIAGMVATWYNSMINGGEKSQFKEDATALTSCANAHIFVSAIATEIHYFDKFWSNQVKKALDISENCDVIKYNLTNEDDDKRNTSNIVQGLKSGRDKVKWYYSGLARNVVAKVSNILRDTGASNWASLWYSVKETPETVSPRLNGYIQQAISFLFFYSACNDCLTYAQFWEMGEKPQYYNDYQKEYEERSKTVRTELDKDWFSKLNAISELEDFLEKKDAFYKLVREALHTSEDLVENIEDEVETTAEEYTINYSSALIFEVDALSPDCVEEKIMQVWSQQTDLSMKTHLNIISFPQLSEISHCRQYGLFYGISSPYEGGLCAGDVDYTECTKVLLSLYQQLCSVFSGRANSIRVLMIPHIPAGRKFRHNAQRNIEQNIERFSKRVVQKFESSYVGNATQQLVLAMTDSVKPECLEYVKELAWQKCQEQPIDSLRKGFSQVVTFYNGHLAITEPSKIERIFYSTVVLHCDSESGMGLLVRTNNRVVCVTCNHVIKKYGKAEGIKLEAEADNDISFELRPINEICVADSIRFIPAAREVAILEPLWELEIPYEIKQIISLDELNSKLDEYIGKECQCCSCVNKRERVWKRDLKLIGRTENGYYQIADPYKKLTGGSSGGVTVVNSTIIGIHKGRIIDTENNAYPLLIPSAVIKEEIMKLEEVSK